jgi:branched-chain amino acid transport system permease protein
MPTLSEIKKSALVSLWFMFLTFPIMVIRVNTTEKLVLWRWENMIYVGIGSFLLSFVWRYLLWRKEIGKRDSDTGGEDAPSIFRRVLSNRKYAIPAIFACFGFVGIFPFVMDTYQTNIMITALMYIVLGLGLNIVVGLAGLLDLGYVAFYAVGAYTYGLLNHHFGLGFWTVLPLGAVMGAFFGILLGFPVLRLRGDYLAIVTLGFGKSFA